MLVFLVAGSMAGGEPSAPSREWNGENSECLGGLHPQPSGQFAVLLFCEGALGTYLTVVRTEPLGAPTKGAWTLRDRVWCDDRWGADVTGYRWSKDGSRLFVTTSEVYGSGGAFALDLERRTSSQLFPRDGTVTPDSPGPGFTLKQLEQE